MSVCCQKSPFQLLSSLGERRIAIKVQIDAGSRDREVRGKETESLFEDAGLFCPVTDHTVQSAQSSSSLQALITRGQRSARDKTATGVDVQG